MESPSAITRTALLSFNLITGLSACLNKGVRKTQLIMYRGPGSLPSLETHRGWQEDSQVSCPAQPHWSAGSSRDLRAYVLTGTSWDPSPLSSHGRMRTRMMKRRTKRNESHPHKTVICRMCATRRSGEGGRKSPTMKQQTSEPTLCYLSLPKSTSSSRAPVPWPKHSPHNSRCKGKCRPGQVKGSMWVLVTKTLGGAEITCQP